MENSYFIKNIPEYKKQRPITFRATERYKKKISATCKILSGNEGSGFFCEIKVNNKLMKVLFTNNHVINNLNSDIKIEHNRKKKIIKLNNRFKYTNEELDYTCIEILEEDGFNNYFKIDKNINNNNPYEEYKYDEFVMIQYPGGDDVSFAEGYINDIIDKNILYTMNTEGGSSGSPLILDTRNLKIIGIHYSRTNNDEKKAIFMKYIINDIEKQLKKNNNNQLSNKNYKNINNLNDNNNKTINNNPKFTNNNYNNKSSSQNNNKKDIIQNNQIQKFKPIGTYKLNNKIYDMYSEEQFKENKWCW